TGTGDYRYAFNGMEREDEWSGTGNGYDFGARIYNPRIGRWLARDPLEYKISSQAPYHYSSNSPIARIDLDGMWDVEVHAYEDRKRHGMALLIVRDRHGNEVYRTEVRVQGHKDKIGESRRKKFGDTPTGTYKIIGWADYTDREDGRGKYGPNKILQLEYVSGEAKGKRQGMHVHGGRQEEQSDDGTWKRKSNPTLWNTAGCMRIDDNDLLRLKTVTDWLEAEDELEKKGNLVVKDDLVNVGEEYYKPNFVSSYDGYEGENKSAIQGKAFSIDINEVLIALEMIEMFLYRNETEKVDARKSEIQRLRGEINKLKLEIDELIKEDTATE
ncbi:MAG: hypothetical protein KDC92_12300, partial [Bacteroidetes bacterium]|nr:hypothetical protein [Bacteroidota bacterium]